LLVGDRTKPAHHTLCELVDIHRDRLELHRIDRYPDRIDQPVDDSDQVLGLVADDFDILARWLAQSS